MTKLKYPFKIAESSNDFPDELTATEYDLWFLESIEHERPTRRSQCRGGERPCCWVSCKYNLLLDVTRGGQLIVNHSIDDFLEMEDTCVLDIEERGGDTLEGVGANLQLTRERIRQIERRAFEKIRNSRQSAEYRKFCRENYMCKP